jgi:GNAT superfamily N-acetyltransferase
VQEHAGALIGNSGIWILALGGSLNISLPPGAAALTQHARTWSIELIYDANALGNALSTLRVTKVIGPALIGYGTAETLNLSDARDARELTAADTPAVERLRSAGSTEEWQHGGSRLESVARFGVTDESGELAAVASYEVWGTLAHIAVLSDPRVRGRGFGRAAVARAALHATDAGLIPQYRTLFANFSAMGIARRLGFEEYGFSVYVRLA